MNYNNIKNLFSNIMAKYRLEGSKTCAICLDDIDEGILLHKTQRQTHMLCLTCGEAYILSQLNDNLNAKNYVHTIQCSGTFNQNKRNVCKKTLTVTDIKIPDKIEKVHLSIAKITSLTMPGATECLSGICSNVVLVPENTDVATCTDCHINWCQKCKVTPYHVQMSCQQYKFMNDSSPETIQIKELIMKGEIKLCPTCHVGISRIDGCNKVICTQCKNAMCWLCSAENIGYDHFGGDKCKLFRF
jgi:hypothetical protein